MSSNYYGTLVLAMADLASTQLEDLLQVREVLNRLPLHPEDALKLMDNQISGRTIENIWNDPKVPKTPFSDYPLGLQRFMRDAYPSRNWDSVPFVLVVDFFFAIGVDRSSNSRLSPLLRSAVLSWKRFLAVGFVAQADDDKVLEQAPKVSPT